jgi:hypothetical protein
MCMWILDACGVTRHGVRRVTGERGVSYILHVHRTANSSGGKGEDAGNDTFDFYVCHTDYCMEALFAPAPRPKNNYETQLIPEDARATRTEVGGSCLCQRSVECARDRRTPLQSSTSSCHAGSLPSCTCPALPRPLASRGRAAARSAGPLRAPRAQWSHPAGSRPSR